MTEITFKEFAVRKGKWAVEWEWIGEGNSGDYQADDPDDLPRLRANMTYDGETVEDGSYCTLATPDTPKTELEAASKALLETVDDDPASFKRRIMERWTWTEYSK